MHDEGGGDFVTDLIHNFSFSGGNKNGWSFYSLDAQPSSRQSGGGGTEFMSTTQVATAVKHFGTAIGDLSDTLQDAKKIGQEIGVTSTSVSKFVQIAKGFKVFGIAEGVQIFANLVSGSIEAERHTEIMDEFEKVNIRFDQLDAKLEEVQNFLAVNAWNAQQSDNIGHLEDIGIKYRAYMHLQDELAKKGESCNTTLSKRDLCITREKELIAQKNSIKLLARKVKTMIEGKAPLIADADEKCDGLMWYKTKFTYYLTETYKAFQLGCILDYA